MRGSTIAFRIEAASRPVALTQYPLARAAGTPSPCVAEMGEEPTQCGSLMIASENVTCAGAHLHALRGQETQSDAIRHHQWWPSYVRHGARHAAVAAWVRPLRHPSTLFKPHQPPLQALSEPLGEEESEP